MDASGMESLDHRGHQVCSPQSFLCEHVPKGTPAVPSPVLWEVTALQLGGALKLSRRRGGMFLCIDVIRALKQPLGCGSAHGGGAGRRGVRTAP